MSALEIPGWSVDCRAWFDFILPRIPQGGTYLEVGVFLGASLAYVGEKRPDLRLVAVDPWEDGNEENGWDGPGIFADEVKRHGGLFFAFLANMRNHAPEVLRRTHVLRGTSTNIMWCDWVDLLFIDGQHTGDAVEQDLETFGQSVRVGGIVSGHDYDPFWDGGRLCHAVDSFLRTKPTLGTPDGHAPTTWWAKAS